MNQAPLPVVPIQTLGSQSLRQPRDLNAHVHATIFAHLACLIQDAVTKQVAKSPDDPTRLEWEKLRLRDWQLVKRDGQTICDVFLDKGHSWLQYDDFADRPGHTDNLSIVTIEECLIIHKALAQNKDFLELFGDQVVFEVGSSGDEPPLRTAQDFLAASGLFIAIETWTKAKNQDRHKGRLVAVLNSGTEDPSTPALPNAGTPFKVQVLLENGVLQTFDVSDIRHASLLLFHPGNFKS